MRQDLVRALLFWTLAVVLALETAGLGPAARRAEVPRDASPEEEGAPAGNSEAEQTKLLSLASSHVQENGGTRTLSRALQEALSSLLREKASHQAALRALNSRLRLLEKKHLELLAQEALKEQTVQDLRRENARLFNILLVSQVKVAVLHRALQAKERTQKKQDHRALTLQQKNSNLRRHLHLARQCNYDDNGRRHLRSLSQEVKGGQSQALSLGRPYNYTAPTAPDQVCHVQDEDQKRTDLAVFGQVCNARDEVQRQNDIVVFNKVCYAREEIEPVTALVPFQEDFDTDDETDTEILIVIVTIETSIQTTRRTIITSSCP